MSRLHTGLALILLAGAVFLLWPSGGENEKWAMDTTHPIGASREFPGGSDSRTSSPDDRPPSKAPRALKVGASLFTTESGLQYEVLREGEGDRPGPTDLVKVHYEGTLTDGTVFDSSYERGTPAELPLNAVIKGWAEGLQLMQVGSKYRFIIPADLSYGSKGAGAVIPPDAILVFEVELLSITEK